MARCALGGTSGRMGEGNRARVALPPAPTLPPATSILAFNDLVHAFETTDRGGSSGLDRFGLDGRCWGKGSERWRVGCRYGMRFCAQGLRGHRWTHGAVCIGLCVGKCAKGIGVFGCEELAHLIAVTRQVIACHAKVFEELRYWGDGFCRELGGVIHVGEGKDLKGRDEGKVC